MVPVQDWPGLDRKKYIVTVYELSLPDPRLDFHSHTHSTLYSTEACIPEFSIGECMIPNMFIISYEEK